MDMNDSMRNRSWHVCGCYNYNGKKLSIDFMTNICDTIYDAIKQAEEYGVTDISRVFVSGLYDIIATHKQKGATII